MNILVTGRKGQLGSEIHFLAQKYIEFNFLYTDVDELDITKKNLVNDFFKENKIDLVINCAAYTAVDKAEDNFLIANRVNNLAVNNLIEACQNYNVKIIHISTDYVFDGTNYIPYVESDIVNPMGVYGVTKYLGEQHLLTSNVKGIIIRTSWVYSSFGNNFVKTMMRLGKERDNLNVIYDQIGTPTYARDLAEACLELALKSSCWSKQPEVYHYSNEGVTSWYDFALAVMEFKKIKCNVNSILTKDYDFKAVRPHYSVLDKKKIKQKFDIKVPHWRVSLKKCLTSL